MRVLLDTNVVLDYFLARQPFDVEAGEIFKKLAANKFEGFVSPITVINSFYTIRKQKDKAVAFQAISKMLKIVDAVKTDKQILVNALSANFKDYEDAVQNESAVAENLDAIVTRNTKDFADSTLKVYTPQEFLQTI